jgi:hypothetical protein
MDVAYRAQKCVIYPHGCTVVLEEQLSDIVLVLFVSQT